MKRNEHILPLSREHHFGLLFCWKLRQAEKKNIAIARVRPYVGYFMDSHLESHFALEENLLFNMPDDPLCAQAIAEHRQIGQQAKDIIEGKSDAIDVLADLLDQHIRFEERVLFPHLEQLIPPFKLQEIGLSLHEHESTDAPKDDYPDAFWS